MKYNNLFIFRTFLLNPPQTANVIVINQIVKPLRIQNGSDSNISNLFLGRCMMSEEVYNYMQVCNFLLKTV